MNVDINSSFKELNPIMCTSPGILELYSHYDKELADKMMWSIFMYDYPHKKLNPKSELPKDIRLDEIIKIYNNKFDLKNKAIDAARHAFLHYCMSFEEKMYAIQKRKLEEGTMLFDKLDLEEDNDFDKYMKMSDKLGKVWDNFEKIKKQYLTKEQESTQVEGGEELSGSEKRRVGMKR